MTKGRVTVVSTTARVTFRDVGFQEGIYFEGVLEEHSIPPPLLLISLLPRLFFSSVYP